MIREGRLRPQAGAQGPAARPARRAARSDALQFACLGPNSRAVQGRGATGPKCLLLPLDSQPDFALPGVGVAIEADIVVDVAVEARGVTDRHGRANAERRPADAGVNRCTANGRQPPPR